MNLIQEFHSDHHEVIAALFGLRKTIASQNIAQVRSILDGAESLVGPHFKFEEQYLYAAVERFLGERATETKKATLPSSEK